MYELVKRIERDNRRNYKCNLCEKDVNDKKIVIITEYLCYNYPLEVNKVIENTACKRPIKTNIYHFECSKKLLFHAVSNCKQL